MPYEVSEQEFRPAYRTIASCYPPINIFEDYAPKEDWEALIELEMATNPRILQDVGDISYIPVARRISGTGATPVMAAFTHYNENGDRFTDGTYGAYYASNSFETSVAERVHLLNAYMSEPSKEFGPDQMDQRVYVGEAQGSFVTVESLDDAVMADEDGYKVSQAFAREHRDAGVDGIIYPSKRLFRGINMAAFWPDVVSIPRQERHLQFHYDGERVDCYFDYSLETWIDIDPDEGEEVLIIED